MPRVYSIRLEHPKNQLSNSKLSQAWLLCEPCSEDIVKPHMAPGDMSSKIIWAKDWDNNMPWYMPLINLEAINNVCLDGFNMIHFWFNRKCAGFMVGWERWYAYVSRSTSTRWTVTLLLDGKGKTDEEAKDISEKLWLTYKEYFDSKLLYNTCDGENSYRDQDYEKIKDKLFVYTKDNRCDLDKLIDEIMSTMPRMGEVYRADRHGGEECLLWCHINDNCKKRTASTVWFP